LKTGHLTQEQCDFFKKWENLISLEEGDLVRFRKELWTMGAAERERAGRCFSNMRLDDTFQESSFKNLGKGEKIRRSTYRFMRDSGPFKNRSLLNGQMCVGDAVTISVEPDLLALAKGYIWELTPDHMVVGVDHEISLEVIRTRLLAHRDKNADNGQVIFRIDKDEMFGGMGRIRDNLTRLFYVDGDKASLELIVDLRKPRFIDAGSIDIPPDSLISLNASQQRAVTKVLTAEDYALVLGMPGTGKTTVVAALIRILVGLGKSVLLTSYTHSAVDTILAKLHQETFGILRLGNIDKVGIPYRI
jgi:DNA replication ATP-dependent helicase Dna2